MDPKIAESLIKLLMSNNDGIDYITKRIVINSSGVILGCKPACTVTFKCGNVGLNPLELWESHKDIIFQDSNLEYYELYNSKSHILVMIFHRDKLSKALAEEDAASFLDSLGYHRNWSIEKKLNLLKNRMKVKIPHEIGIFLGIPLKDVLGFMGLNSLEFTCCSRWKVYGEPESSISLSMHYEECKNRIIYMLENNIDSMEILRGAVAK